MFKLIGRSPEKLREHSVEAYEALPEPYKSDSCMYYFVWRDGTLCADFDLGGLFYFMANDKSLFGGTWIEAFGSDIEPPGEWVIANFENGSMEYVLDEG